MIAGKRLVRSNFEFFMNLYFNHMYRKGNEKGTQIKDLRRQKWVKHAELQIRNGNKIIKKTPWYDFPFSHKM
jgi:hypothetical protein